MTSVRWRSPGWLAVALLFSACGGNPILGDWEVDRDDNPRSVLLAVDATDLDTLGFSEDAVVSPGTSIPVRYVVEENVVRVIRSDGRGQHRVDLLPDGRIRAELPIGVTAVYRPAGS
jgi:hypothetical protein